MENHAVEKQGTNGVRWPADDLGMIIEQHASDVVRRIAEEVRAELARKRLPARRLAVVLGVTEGTIGRRLNGETPFNTVELILTSAFLGLGYTELMDRATRGLMAVAS
ncbi:hypothetical protein [Microbacterium maritypicum]|uniref:hypothetical protein n=1 Tax=Microbacterium maritypicum TaxID=33918 RepID=UPI00382AA73B